MYREGLWYKVLSSRYGDKRGQIKDGGRYGSVWLREIVKIRERFEIEGGSWFEESIQMKIDNGIKTFFWSDSWVGAAPLRERFRRLFHLSVQKDKMVAEMSSLGWEKGGEA